MKEFEREILIEMRDGAIGGAVVEAGNADGAKLLSAYGLADPVAKVPMRTDTIIDVASITKIIATSASLLLLRDRGLIDLDAPFTDYIDFHAELKTPITVRELSMHVSGFPEGLPYWDEDGLKMREKVRRFPPRFPPNTNYEYSCWNYQLLGQIIERLSGMTLREFATANVFLPLEMFDTSLGTPVTDDPARLARTDTAPRAGAISDPVAFRIYRDGACAGNAGAFSTAPDLGKFCRMLLSGGGLFSADSLAEFTRGRQVAPSGIGRAIGFITWDDLMPDGFSTWSVQHSGWSGQTIFVDMERDFYAVVLTSRIGHYNRTRLGRRTIAEWLRRETGL